MRDQQVMERIIQRKFRNPKLLEEALIAAGADVEPPMNNKKRQGNKRLALIGDAVLRLTLVDDGILLGKTTGQCQTICSAEASNAALFKIEEQHHLASFIQTSPAQKGHVSPITGATTVEALVGAVWLDCGRNYAHVHEIIHGLGVGESLLNDLEHTYGPQVPQEEQSCVEAASHALT